MQISSAKIIHDQILERLKKDSTIDLTTLPTLREQQDMRRTIQGILASDYSAAEPDVQKRVDHEFFSAGPIEELLVLKDLTEIIINGPDSIWYENSGKLFHHYDHFLSIASFQNFIQRLMIEAGVCANLDRPFADGHWRGFRLHLVLPPLAAGQAHITLRRHPQNPWTLAHFEKIDWASAAAITQLRKMVLEKWSFLIVGGTGSGKTSVLNACLQEVEARERVITIEDTSEIQLPNPASVKLLSRTDLNGVLRSYDQSELLRQSLRMRPDRIVVGEVRGAEAKDLLMALSTGHRGGLCTLHAENARQALYRLEMLVQMGAPQWSLGAIRNLIYFGIQAIVVIKKDKGHRKLDSIHKLTSLEETGYLLEQVI